MAKVIVGMTISLDGFVADQNGNAGRLYPDLAALRHTAYMKDAIEQTGAVLMGRRTFEMGDPDSYVGNYEFQVPIFVLTHHPPSVAPKQDEHLTFTFVTDGVESAVAQAKAAARDKAVQVVGGVSIARQLLDAGLVDELHVDIMPVFLGIGLQSFESCSLERVRLEKINVQEVGARTSLRFRVKQELTFWADFAERVGEGEIDFVVGEALSLTGEILLFGSGGEGGQLARGLQRALINCGGGLGGGVLFGSGGRAARCELSVRNTPRTVARTSTSSTATVIHWRAFIGWSGVVPS